MSTCVFGNRRHRHRGKEGGVQAIESAPGWSTVTVDAEPESRRVISVRRTVVELPKVYQHTVYRLICRGLITPDAAAPETVTTITKEPTR